MTDYALIIAVENYADQAIRPVIYAERDAHAMDAALAALGFRTTVLLSAKATKATIESTVRRIAGSASATDSIYLFFAGHGFAKDDKNYLKCHDTVHGDQPNTSVELQAVFSALRKSKVKRVALFLDACESGSEPDANARGIFSSMNDAELEEFFKNAEGAMCFAACKSNESSYSHGSIKHGIWTYHLVEALSGRAKLAAERGFVTATTLQNYLAHEVPLRVRALRNRPDPQNPWATGAMSKEFVIADLRPLLEAQKKQRLAAAKQITQAYLNGEERMKVSHLTGFRRTHRVPESVNAATIEFVQRVSADDLKQHLDAIYEALKSNMGYKRRDLVESDNGIVTPHFEYQVTVNLDRDAPSNAVWTYVINNMTNKDVIFSEGFEKIFSDRVDTAVYEFASTFEVEEFIDLVEDLDSDEIRVTYKRGEPECDVQLAGFDAVIHLTPAGVHITGMPAATPRKLLEAVPMVQKLLVVKKLPALPL